jgi:molybdopterin-guanine dinucleotide biosynthesis protein B
MPRILHIVGCKNAGKTRACEVLIGPLHRLGLTVGTLKYTDHDGFDWDQPGKDTFRHREAGSDVTGIFGLRSFAFQFQSGDCRIVAIDDLARTFYPSVDLLLVEGYRRGSGSMLEVCRPGYSDGPKYGTPPRPGPRMMRLVSTLVGSGTRIFSSPKPVCRTS